MIVIAILLLAAISVVTAGVVFGGEQDATLSIFGEAVRASAWEIFAIGVACGLAVPIALWLLTVGTRRAAIRRRKAREMRAAHERERAELAREREELEAERNKLRNGGGPPPDVGPGAPEDRPADRATPERDADRPDERRIPDRPGSPPDRDTDYERLSRERESPTAHFDVERPGVRPANSGSQRNGLGPPSRTDSGFDVFRRPAGP